MSSRGFVVGLTLTLVAPLAAQQPQAPPEGLDTQTRYQIRQYEIAVRAAVLHAGEQLATRASALVPGALLAPSTEPVVRFVPTPEGPRLRRADSVAARRRPGAVAHDAVAATAAQQVRPVAQNPDRVTGAGVVAADPMTKSPVQEQGFDPDKEYTAFAREALIDVLLDNSSAVPLKDGQRLEIAASGLEITRPTLYPDNSRKLVLVITRRRPVRVPAGQDHARRSQSPDQRSPVLIYNRPAMLRRPLVAVAALVALVLAPAACGPDIDIAKSLTITDVISGYYDNGLKDGRNYLHAQPHVPARQLGVREPHGPRAHRRRTGKMARTASGIPCSFSASATTRSRRTASPIRSRSAATVGYRLEEARADLFTHSQFKDVTAKIFARRGGRIYPIGSVKLDHQIIPHVKSGRP